MGLDLYDELRCIVVALNDAHVSYALAGGLALAVHGVSRATADIDLVIALGDAKAVQDITRGLGYTLEAAPFVFGDGTQMFRSTRVHDGDHVSLDLLIADGIPEAVLKNRIEAPTDFGTIQVVSRDDLIAMKVRAGRAQDIADIERLRDFDR